MYKELANLYQTQIFDCTHCEQSLMNPYLHCNQKHDPPERRDMPDNRRKFQLDYIASKRDIQVMIVGEAPGLDGCGFAGIAFTGEHNAVTELGLPDYHGTETNFQKEQSANLVYAALKTYCGSIGLKISDAAEKVYLTNAIMCVPLGKSGKSIVPPTRATKLQCRGNLVNQVEILQPRLVVTLGANALNSVAEAFNLKLEGKLTDLVQDQRNSGLKIVTDYGFELISEIHPSPRNRVLGEMYTSLPNRLVQIFTQYLQEPAGISR